MPEFFQVCGMPNAFNKLRSEDPQQVRRSSEILKPRTAYPRAWTRILIALSSTSASGLSINIIHTCTHTPAQGQIKVVWQESRDHHAHRLKKSWRAAHKKKQLPTDDQSHTSVTDCWRSNPDVLHILNPSLKPLFHISPHIPYLTCCRRLTRPHAMC